MHQTVKFQTSVRSVCACSHDPVCLCPLQLRKAVTALEARSDDDLTIGRLQRRLLALRASHRALARKHEATRANLRRKAAAARTLEGHVEAREAALAALSERSRAQVRDADNTASTSKYFVVQ